ncbi:MAG: hypothetical protein AMXMBFR13_02160 [Phycisphaerae bacterium]|jgi:hypothetical protein
MRRFVAIAVRLLPVTGWLFIGACGVTSRQFTDFASSTAIRVFVQSLTSVAEAAILQNFGGT